MDPHRNPFAPGAGYPPPELAGRGDVIKQALLALSRIKHGRAERSPLMIGLRGVGKTVLLGEIRRKAEAEGYRALMVDAQEGGTLARLLLPGLRKVLLSLDPAMALGDKAKRGLRVLKSFLSGIKLGVGEIELSLEGPAEIGSADSGQLESDLADVFVAVGEAAVEASTAVAVVIDELQYLSEVELGALIMAIHKTSQERLPLILVGGRLAPTRRQSGKG